TGGFRVTNVTPLTPGEWNDPTDTLQEKTRSSIHSEGLMVKKLLRPKFLSDCCLAVLDYKEVKDGNATHVNKNNFRWGRPQDSQKFASCDFKGLPNLVNTNRGLRIPLKDLVLRITGLDGTIYWGREGLLKAWGELYLEKPEKMAVLGAIDNAPSMAEGLQLIVLVDSSGRVYFYESEVLHLVAESVKDFFTVGAKSPPIRSYKYGQHCAPKVIMKTPEQSVVM
ncbi:hypothetical protein JZ751_021594, partial [Albula glossodonta]